MRMREKFFYMISGESNAWKHAPLSLEYMKLKNRILRGAASLVGSALARRLKFRSPRDTPVQKK